MRFRNILCVYDDPRESAGAIEKAVQLARTHQASLSLLKVLRGVPESCLSDIITREQRKLCDSALEHLNGLTASLERVGVRARRQVLCGTHFIEIIREVLRNDYDLVIFTPHRATLKEKLFGSRTMHLLRKCPCPVWVVKPSKGRKHSKILAAIDPLNTDDERNQLNVKIMDFAVNLAKVEGSELHIFHSWHDAAVRLLRGTNGIVFDTKRKILRDIRNAHKQRLYSLLAEFDLGHVPHKVHLGRGTPEEGIARIAKQKGVELVVMGTVCRTGLKGFFMGNTAEKTLPLLDCSVLALKPEGFTTPVTLP